MSKIKSNKTTAFSLSADIIKAAEACGSGVSNVKYDNESTILGNKNASNAIQNLNDLLINTTKVVSEGADKINKIADGFENVDQSISKKISE